MSAIDFTIFDRTTGAILRSGACPEKTVAKQVRAGQSILVGEALCDVQHWIEVDVATGQKTARRYTEAQIVDRAPPGWRPTLADLEEPAAEMAAGGINPQLATRCILRRLTAALQAKEQAMQEASNAPESGPPSTP